MAVDESGRPVGTRERNGKTYTLGTSAEVEWIQSRFASSMAITSAIPPVFEAYATVVIPEDDWYWRESDEALLAELNRGVPQPWWLGYLEKGWATDVVFPDAPRVPIYNGGYVLVEAGSEEAARLRLMDTLWRESPLRELIFPADRSWLVSKLWDDDWRCVGGSRGLVGALVAHPLLDAREVTVDQDATPPGHVAI